MIGCKYDGAVGNIFFSKDFDPGLGKPGKGLHGIAG